MRLSHVTLAVSLCLAPLSPALAGDAAPARSGCARGLVATIAANDTAARSGECSTLSRPAMIAGGAVAAIVLVNAAMGGLAYLPFTGVVATTPTAAGESVVAISRVYAVSAAAAGGLLGNYVYETANAAP